LFNQFNAQNAGWQSQQQRAQSQFQPTGLVQSFYNPARVNRTSSFGQNQISANQFQSANQQSFHAANYQGNQQGHDQSLRADSQQPANAQSFQSFHSANYKGNQQGHDQSLRADSQQPANAQSFQSFHAANYQGNKQGHDQYLRADSIQPANVQNFQASQFSR